MPEGPSLIILKEEIHSFKGKKIVHASGNADIAFEELTGKKIRNIRTLGKQLFIELGKVTIRIHLLMFGTYSVDKQIRAKRSLRLKLECKNSTLYFYTCSVRLIYEDLDDLFDWEADVMSDSWKPRKARSKLKKMEGMMVCDALLDQDVFSGVGNIIKNEVLYRIRLHPETLVENIPSRKLGELIREARKYSFEFLTWKKEFTLKKHWLAHTRKKCVRCSISFVKKYCGKTKRRTFFCENCQIKYK